MVFGLITGLTLWEFYGLTKHYEKANIERFISSAGGAYLFIATFAYANALTDDQVFLPYIAYLIYVFVAGLYHKDNNPINNWALTLLAQIYCAAPFAILNFLMAIPNTPGEIVYFPYFALSIFIFVWLNDTGAYLIGSLFGRRKLFERISPNKSWEGFFGGLLFAAGASQVFAWFHPHIGWTLWLGLAVTVVIAGTWGDLVESLIKRTLGVKDSGNLLPGHGGLLDRFDSVLLAIPAAYLFLRLFIIQS